MRNLLTILNLGSIVLSSIYCNQYSQALYDSIEDITNPTLEDYLLIEEYIRNGQIPYQRYQLDWKRTPRPRELKLVDGDLSSIERHVYYIKRGSNSLQNCVFIYTPLDPIKIQCAENLIEAIRDSKYSGHIIYQKGGFPNLVEGDLRLAHIPNGFKLAGMREAYRLGYQKVLWLNCNLIPQINLSLIFNSIAMDNFYAYRLPSRLPVICFSKEFIPLYNLCENRAFKYYCLYAGVLGFDLTDSTATSIISSWYDMCINNEKTTYTSGRDSTVLSYIAKALYDMDHYPYYVDHFRVNDEHNLHFLFQ